MIEGLKDDMSLRNKLPDKCQGLCGSCRLWTAFVKLLNGKWRCLSCNHES